MMELAQKSTNGPNNFSNVDKGGGIMAYQRKTRDRWDICTNYGYGWECECSGYTYKEAKQTAKEYRENTCALVRIEKHRERLEG